MKVALFVPCFISSNYPEVAIATLELLERLGCTVAFPFDQTCCGQPLANEGDQKNAAPAEANFVRCFADEDYDYIVGPSASCVLHIRENMDAIPQTEEVKRVRKNTYELVEFLHDVLKVPELPWAEFPHKVALHNSCSSLRGLRIASMSELREEPFSKPLDLLAKVKGIEFVQLDRPDECCGFGGLFSVFEEGVSAKMGYDKVDDQKRAGAEYVVSADMSCMMHQKGCAERLGYPQKYVHIAQVLNGYQGGDV
jgi:L-lactate dehydrogenase complex protein LldE